MRFTARIRLSFKTRPVEESRYGGTRTSVIRVQCRVRFRDAAGQPTDIWSAIVDTGAPFAMLPQRMWRILDVDLRVADSSVGGISRREACRVPTSFGIVHARLEDECDRKSRWYAFPAHLAKTDQVPLIIGFADMLSEFKLTIDYPANEAWAEERRA